MQSAVFTATPGSGPPGGPAPFLNEFPNVVWMPAITQPPQNQIVAVGQPATFSVGISSPLLSVGFQWRKDQIPILNATAQTLIIPSVQLTNAGAYDVVITNAFGSVTSAPPAYLMVGSPPIITSQPQSQTVVVGRPLTNLAGVTGTPPMTSYWYRADANIATATIFASASTNGIILPNIQPSDAGNYQVIFTNLWGSTTSAVASITVVALPTVLRTTNYAYLAVGGGVTLTSRATGVGLSYQWLFNGTNIAGATSQTLTLTNATLQQAGHYSVQVSNLAGTIWEEVVTLNFTGNLEMYAGFVITGNPGEQITVKSANVIGGVTNWLVLTNFVHPGGEHLFIDRTSPGRDKRFYQVERPPN
jgi:hypothetical protein